MTKCRDAQRQKRAWDKNSRRTKAKVSLRQNFATHKGKSELGTKPVRQAQTAIGAQHSHYCRPQTGYFLHTCSRNKRKTLPILKKSMTQRFKNFEKRRMAGPTRLQEKRPENTKNLTSPTPTPPNIGERSVWRAVKKTPDRQKIPS